MAFGARTLSLLGLLAVAAAGPAFAGPVRESVALLPVAVVNADPTNAAPMAAALRENLVQHGRELVEPARVEQAIQQLGIELGQPQFVPALDRLGKRLGADLVVYARVLVQGPMVKEDAILDPHRPAIVVHLMVVDCRSSEQIMSNQVAQEWSVADPDAMPQTAPAEATRTAADRLLEFLYQPTQVSGQLLDEETGRPLAGVEAFLRQEGEETRVVLTDAEGRFSFREVARRPSSVATHAPGYHNGIRHLPFSLGEKRVALRLKPRTAGVSGYVRRADGSPVVGLPVYLKDEGGRAMGSATTLRDGSFGRGGLKPGRYTLAATLPDGVRLEREVELRPGDFTSVELKATPAIATGASLGAGAGGGGE